MMKQNEILGFSLTKDSKCIQSGEISPVELVENLLNRLDQVDPILNSFITVNRKGAIKEAIEMKREIKRGNYRGPLHGIPIGVKDNIDTKRMKTTERLRETKPLKTHFGQSIANRATDSVLSIQKKNNGVIIQLT